MKISKDSNLVTDEERIITSEIVEEKCNKSLDFVYSYSVDRLNKLHSRMNLVDSKASTLMQFIGVMFGLVFLANFFDKLENGIGIIFLLIFAVFLMTALIFTILVLQVKRILDMPNPESIVMKIIDSKEEINDNQLKQSLILNIINAEKSILPILKKKTKQLMRAQIFLFLGILFLIICTLMILIKIS